MEKWKVAILSGEDCVPTENGIRTSQAYTKPWKNSKKVLATVYIGLRREDGSTLIDIDKSPWSKQGKSTVKASNKELVYEVFRRQKLLGGLEGVDSNKEFHNKSRNKTTGGTTITV
jgi:hypothetical protein